MDTSNTPGAFVTSGYMCSCAAEDCEHPPGPPSNGPQSGGLPEPVGSRLGPPTAMAQAQPPGPGPGPSEEEQEEKAASAPGSVTGRTADDRTVGIDARAEAAWLAAKQALVERNGDLGAAVEWLRTQPPELTVTVTGTGTGTVPPPPPPSSMMATPAPTALGEGGTAVAALTATPPTSRPSPLPGGVFDTLTAESRQRHPDSDTVVAVAPEEADRVPMLERGVTLAFLRRMRRECTALGRPDIDAGQFLNGVHTTHVLGHGLAGVRPGAGWVQVRAYPV
mmetsp:Transcript_68507/g.190514  ORF Transcript_68507/g.190514 Transcript_68507/m.190514 type:complete len:279 (-) Transcript_68507:240-1076(-)